MFGNNKIYESADMKNTKVNPLIYQEKRAYFDSGNTRSYHFRIAQLAKFKRAIQHYEKAILKALHDDLHKPAFEAFTSEVGFLYEEINFAIKNLEKWMRPKRVSTPLVLEASRSKVISEPLGVVLVIGPWNYPFQLLLSPVVGAIAAGNCTVIKPSNETPQTAKIIEKVIHETFDSRYMSVVQGAGSTIGAALIQQFPWNHIFFTGSPKIGAKVAELAAPHLSPVTLELGGKSPAIVDKHVNLDKAAKRIVFGKFFNAGQTCVSPDYALVHKSVKEKFLKRVKHYIKEFYGHEPLKSKHLAHIVNAKRFEVLKSYLQHAEIFHGGKFKEEGFVMEPTIVHNVKMDSPLMQEEIFGPILPVLEWENQKDIIEIVRKNRYPLACYIFTKAKSFEKYIINNIEFGGGAVNNTIVQLINPKLPFGGVGSSGMGQYHGKYSFDTFSHKKAVLKTSTKIDLSMRYAPYSDKDLKRARLFFK